MRALVGPALMSLSLVAACNARIEESPPDAQQAPASATEPADSPSLLPVSYCDRVTLENHRTVLFDALVPLVPYDYFALFATTNPTAYAGHGDEFEVIAERGVLCANAGDVAACKAAYAGIPTVEASIRYCFTRGDAIGCLDTKADAMAFLGEIDSVDEAMFIAAYDDYQGGCHDERIRARGAELPDGTFRLALHRTHGCDDSLRFVIDVSRDGTIVERSSWMSGVAFGCW